jgi:hypothetical protein
MSYSPERQLIRHFLAAIAYRTQKAVRDAPETYWTFAAGKQVRTPIEILRHMSSVLRYARTSFIGGDYPVQPKALPGVDAEIGRFHDIIEDLAQLLMGEASLHKITEEQLLQGPLSDVMTHVGQLALLRRLHGSPVPPENFVHADISPTRLGKDQPEPRRPDKEWPERPTT